LSGGLDERRVPGVTPTLYRLRPRATRVEVNGSVLLGLGDTRMKISPLGPVERDVMVLLIRGCTAEDIDEACAHHAADERARGPQLLQALAAKGFVEQDAGPPDGDLDAERFSSLLDLFSGNEDAELDKYESLARLRRSTVVIVGLGGLGSWVLHQVLCAAVGRVVLVDPDVIELPNLNRTILGGEADVGRAKVDVAREVVGRFAPRTEVLTHRARVAGPGDLVDLLGDACLEPDRSLLIGCADKPYWLIRQWLAQAACALGVPEIQAASGRVGPFHVPGRTSCIMCYFATQRERQPALAASALMSDGLLSGHAANGKLAMLAGIASGMMAHEGFRYLSGFAPPQTLDRVLVVNRDFTSHYEPLAPSLACPVCGDGSPL
jgi:hypothetical protein